jgi:hypothetical protein
LERRDLDTMKVYLAGPMRGYPNFNFPAFHQAAQMLRDAHYTVFNPAERDASEFGNVNSATGSEEEFAEKVGMTRLELARNCFLADTTWICKEADAIALLPGWEKSKGACAEKALAEALGLEVIVL